ncbi:phosphatase PAP2 family protein [Clostridium sp. DL1XJH146]
MFTKIKYFSQDYKHLFVLSYYIVILVTYSIFNKSVVPKYMMHSVIDDYIPFVKIMVVPYVYWYAFIVVPFIFFAINNKKDFYNLAFFIFAGMTISFIIYAILPNGHNLRPAIYENDFLSNLIKLLYSIDKPTNSAPSMHVIDTIAVYVAVMNNEKLSKIKRIRAITLISMILIILSTVMIKQHSILDVFAGMALSLVLYVVIYKLDILSIFANMRWRKRKASFMANDSGNNTGTSIH